MQYRFTQTILHSLELWGGHIWSRNYYMSTLGNMSKEVVAKYIQNQYSK